MSDYQYSRMTVAYGGVDIIESIHAVERFEDWSGVRSPSRARRRLRRGFRQKIVIHYKPVCIKLPNGNLVVHPTLMTELRTKVTESMRAESDRITEALFYGRTI